jgi:hypothetical protein
MLEIPLVIKNPAPDLDEVRAETTQAGLVQPRQGDTQMGGGLLAVKKT